jgi:hypothetical protein
MARQIFKDNVYSNLEVKHKIHVDTIHARLVVVDTIIANEINEENMNINMNGGTNFVPRGLGNFKESNNTTTAINDIFITSLIGEDNHLNEDNDNCVIIGGKINHISGSNSICVGGEGNEIQGNNSIILGGQDNQVNSNNSLAIGNNCINIHDHTLIFNGTEENVAKSTAPSQCVLGADNGTMFKLPMSSAIKTNMIDEGFACICWDPLTNTVCVKTKQSNILYKTNLPTMVHEIRVEIDGMNTELINPDDS